MKDPTWAPITFRSYSGESLLRDEAFSAGRLLQFLLKKNLKEIEIAAEHLVTSLGENKVSEKTAAEICQMVWELPFPELVMLLL